MASRWILGEDLSEGGACFGAEAAGGVEVTEGVGIIVASHREGPFIFSIHDDLGPIDGFARMVTDQALDCDLLTRAVVVTGDLEVNLQALLHDLDGELAITETENGLLVFTQVVLRSLDDQDRDKRVGRFLVSEGKRAASGL